MKEEKNQNNYKPKLTPEQKLRQAVNLYNSARRLKEAYLRQMHPDWDDEKIKRKLKEFFLYARSWHI